MISSSTTGFTFLCNKSLVKLIFASKCLTFRTSFTIKKTSEAQDTDASTNREAKSTVRSERTSPKTSPVGEEVGRSDKMLQLCSQSTCSCLAHSAALKLFATEILKLPFGPFTVADNLLNRKQQVMSWTLFKQVVWTYRIQRDEVEELWSKKEANKPVNSCPLKETPKKFKKKLLSSESWIEARTACSASQKVLAWVKLNLLSGKRRNRLSDSWKQLEFNWVWEADSLSRKRKTVTMQTKALLDIIVLLVVVCLGLGLSLGLKFKFRFRFRFGFGFRFGTIGFL